ncbi:TnsA endonuclease N-terminal domain-containing protein [Phenylobacterium soli]|uniref:TnsA endonuclease N-terminal domain-containing protein n=1 Tax=Phenylobacterium soli TaxID=2170551 RepID=UPI001403CAE9|nr:TnsA endonuclease N-terminal domain-containing protein [Phenylobacterium soli]
MVTPDGRPIRSAITGRRVIVTGSYASRKARRTQPHESMNELALFHESEVDVDVLDYRAQPFRFEFLLDGRRTAYIADCFRILSNAPPEVVEVKSDYRHLRDPAYAEKLRLVGEMCRRLGWRFRTVTKEQLLEPKVRRANIQLIQSRRLVHFDTTDVYAATNVLESAGGPTPLGAVCSALGDPRLGMSRAMAMMVARILRIDLSKPLSPASWVTLVNTPRASLREVR